MGTEKMLKRKPKACEAPCSPTKSKAIGPKRQIKRPSQRPITRQMMIRDTKLSANGMQEVVTPSKIKAACCMCMRLMQLVSAINPKVILERPEVILMHIGSKLPLESGKISLVCFTCD